MARQNLTERAAVIALNELGGRVGVRQGRDHLKNLGLLPDENDLIEEGELDFTRRIFQRSEHYQNEDEGGCFEWVNFSDRLEDGSRVDYYKKIHETTVDEAVKDLTYWHGYMEIGKSRLREQFKKYCRIHGKKAIQRRLKFDIPPDEEETEAA